MRITLRTLQIAAVTAALGFAAAPTVFAAPQTPQADTAAAAQTRPAAPASQGPLVLTPIESTFVIAPVAKVTRLLGANAGLAGLYAGKVIEDKLFVGGSAMWLANPTNNTRLWYGGVVAGWTFWTDGRLSARAQTLVGGGQVTRTSDVISVFGPGGPFPPRYPPNYTVRIRENFVIAEPELTLQMKVTDRVRFNLGAGYRGTSTGRNYGFGTDLRGATATVGLEFRIGK
jgi:hypothetical protein